MRRFICQLVVLLFLVQEISYCQQDSIRHEILNYKDTTFELISNGRKLLIQKLNDGDFSKVKEIKDFILGETAYMQMPQFSYYEYWLILCWTKEYDELLHSVLSSETDTMYRWYGDNYYNDDLTGKLRNKSEISKSILNFYIESANLEAKKALFLQLFFDYLIPGKTINQDSLNNKGDNYLKRFPMSNFNGFVKKYIQLKIKYSDWGLGLEFFFGYGTYTNSLAKYFNSCPGFGLSFDIKYKKLCTYLRGFVGFSKTQSDIAFNQIIWKDNSTAEMGIAEASFGYQLFDNKKFKVVPFTGIGSTGIKPSSKDREKYPEYEDVGVNYSTTFIAGINVDIKFGRTLTYNRPYFGGGTGYYPLRIRYSFNVPNYINEFKGNIHCFTLGIGIYGQRIKSHY